LWPAPLAAAGPFRHTALGKKAEKNQ
jgi:hypothetical protein